MSSSDYIVTAVLMAKDRNFQSTFEAANKTTQTLGGKIKSGLGFGALAGIGAKAVGVVGSGLKSLVSELDNTNSAWTSFSSNMAMSGMGSKAITATKKDLQDYAKKTVYTSKDMAATYAQLYAVNKKTYTQIDSNLHYFFSSSNTSITMLKQTSNTSLRNLSSYPSEIAPLAIALPTPTYSANRLLIIPSRVTLPNSSVLITYIPPHKIIPTTISVPIVPPMYIPSVSPLYSSAASSLRNFLIFFQNLEFFIVCFTPPSEIFHFEPDVLPDSVVWDCIIFN